jgi:RHS repeat-associated core domain
VIGGMAFRWYDYGHRMYGPQNLRFMTVDWEAESVPWQTPYCYASNNPIKFIDILGDSATFNGAGAQNAINFLNTQLAGFYTFAMNANGVVSMTAVPQQNN